jgi:outer membrane protein assembly factor BamE (lipoprotein component of BamABCDE complex)
MKHTALALMLALTLGACAPTNATNGTFLTRDDVVNLQPGTSTRSDVLQALGTPTTTAVFDDNTWYYIGQKTTKKAFFDPKVTDREVYEAKFAEDGTLTSLKEVTDPAIDVPIVRRKTPTSGHDLTIAQQLLGNLGRFNKSDAGNSSEPGVGQ